MVTYILYHNILSPHAVFSLRDRIHTTMTGSLVVLHNLVKRPSTSICCSNGDQKDLITRTLEYSVSTAWVMFKIPPATVVSIRLCVRTYRGCGLATSAHPVATLPWAVNSIMGRMQILRQIPRPCNSCLDESLENYNLGNLIDERAYRRSVTAKM